MNNRLITDVQLYGQMETEIRADLLEEIAKETDALINPSEVQLDELKKSRIDILIALSTLLTLEVETGKKTLRQQELDE